MNFLEQIKQLPASDKISKAKITLYRISPFFGYIIEHLKFREDTKNELPCASMGVDAKGNCLFNKEFVNSVTSNQLVGVIAHEGCHPGFQHILRGKGKDIMVNGMSLWNIAIDIITNQLLVENKFELPKDSLLPANNSITVFKRPIENISEKSAEDIYEELKAELKQMVRDGEATENNAGQGGAGDYSVEKDPQKGFDDHLKGVSGTDDDKSDKQEGASAGEGKPDNSVPEVQWDKVVAEAYNHAKLIGKAPAGMERMFSQLQRHKLNWRTLLRKTITGKFPFDLTYSKPNKRYLWQDICMPGQIGESVKVICGIDTSGSISEEELSKFVSEMLGIARTFQQAEFRIVTHDCAVHDDILIKDGNVNKIKRLELHGGGGTDHRPLYDYMEEKRMRKMTKLFISFTDGYSVYPKQKPNVDTIFVLAGAHIPADQMPKWGVTVCLD